MAAPFDPNDYTHAPIITVSTGVALAEALSDACPKDASPGVKKALKHLKALAVKAGDDLTKRNQVLGQFSEEDSRELDSLADRAWGGFRLALTAKAMLPHDKYPHAKRAAEIEVTLFGAGGTEFLRADYATQKTSMATLLKHIDDDGLADDIDAAIGPEYLAEVRAIQPRYSKMVSERLRRDKAMGQNLSETTRGLQEAIVNYARKVTGTIEHDEPETLEWARLALMPIANHREATASRAARTAPDGAASAEGAAPAEGAAAAEGAGPAQGTKKPV